MHATLSIFVSHLLQKAMCAAHRRASRFLLCLALLLTAGLASSDARAQARAGFDLSLAPTANWTSDAEVRLRAFQDNPQNADPDSLLALFNDEERPVQVGFKAGLGLTVSRRWLGVRAGVHLLNTGGVFDGAEYLNEEKLRENFVTFTLDFQLRRAAGPAVFYAFGGPELRYFLDLTGEDEISFSTFRENMEPLSTAVNVGAGVHLRLMGVRLAPEVRYTRGLSGVSGRTFEADGLPFELSEQQRLDNLGLGLVFGL